MEDKKSLTVGELYSLLKQWIDAGLVNLDQLIEIELSDFSIGPHAGAGICAVMPGIDWDSGRLFLIPSKELVSAQRREKK